MSGFTQTTYDLGKCKLVLPKADAVHQIADAFTKMEPWKTLGTDRDRMVNHFLASPDNACRRLVMKDEDVSGIICVTKNWLLGPYLDFLGVLPNAQRAGIGSALMMWLEEEAKLSRARNIFLCVSSFNDDAIGFYEAAGFQKCALLDELIVNEHDEFLMRKRLS